MPMKLGLLPPTPTKPRLRLASFLTARVTPTAPPAVDYVTAVRSYPMYRNDEIGNCGPISLAHFITAAGTYGDGTPYTAPLEEVLDLYSRVSGYDPTTGAHDDGVVMQELLNEARKGGLGQQQILAFAQVDHTNYDEVRSAINLFGAVLVGAALPVDASRQFDAGARWEPTEGPGAAVGSWGGHAIHVGAYDIDTAEMRCTTWGAVQSLTRSWWETYVQEAWVAITPEFLNEHGYTPSDYDLRHLGEEVARITGGSSPFTGLPAEQEPEPSEVTAADPIAEFAETITPWLESRRSGDNRKAQAVVRDFLTATTA
jgi:hypothetical protein